MRKALTIFFHIVFISSQAQIPQVPSHMELGNMKLRITDGGKKIIQEHVNALHQNEKYVQIVADKAHLYFPIISKILYEEGVPDDFKYLCIQESGFRADAVSSSNAVGWWQFKDFTAREVGLFVENDADERKHIIYSTKGAAKYLKKNYFYLKNWIYTCQSYQQGLGGTQRSVDKSLFGVDKMTIDKNTYWYVMKFLAHKIAYADILKRHPSVKIDALKPVLVNSGEKLSDVANNNSVSLEEIEKNNIWLKRSRIPDYREEYYIMIPGEERIVSNKNTQLETITIELEESDPEEISRISSHQFVNPTVRIILKINNKKAILSNTGDIPVTLALRGGITKDQLLNYNDLIPGEEIITNMVYYLQPKNNRSKISRHITKEGETLWEISQKYGIKEKALMKINRLKLGEEPKIGRVLHLRKRIPKDGKIEYVKLKKVLPTVDSNSIESPIKKDTTDKIEIERNIQIDSSEIEKQVEIDSSQSSEDLNEDSFQINSEFQKEDLEYEEEVIDSVQKPELVKEINNTIVHKVSAGETLYSISKKYEVKVEDIVEWNQLKDLSLSIGQELTILKN